MGRRTPEPIVVQDDAADGDEAEQVERRHPRWVRWCAGFRHAASFANDLPIFPEMLKGHLIEIARCASEEIVSIARMSDGRRAFVSDCANLFRARGPSHRPEVANGKIRLAPPWDVPEVKRCASAMLSSFDNRRFCPRVLFLSRTKRETTFPPSYGSDDLFPGSYCCDREADRSRRDAAVIRAHDGAASAHGPRQAVARPEIGRGLH